MRFEIDGQGHTLGCLLRDAMFECGAEFAACTVPHPLHHGLVVTIEGPRPAKTIAAEASQRVRCIVEAMIASVPGACADPPA